MNRIGVLGGTFDPIHIGHLAAALDVLEALTLDRVLFVPNRQQPLKGEDSAAEARHRLAMIELAIADEPRFELSRLELDRPGPSYTIDTMRRLRSELEPKTVLYFLLGTDALEDLAQWREPDALLAEFRLAVMERPTDAPIAWDKLEARFPGIRDRVDCISVARLDIQSRDLRRRLQEGRPIRYQVVPAVERYIGVHRLYRLDNS